MLHINLNTVVNAAVKRSIREIDLPVNKLVTLQSINTCSVLPNFK